MSAIIRHYANLDLDYNNLIHAKIEKVVEPSASTQNEGRIITQEYTVTGDEAVPAVKMRYGYMDESTQKWETLYRYELNKLRPPTDNVDLSTKKIISLGAPTNDTDAATKKYVDDSVMGLIWQPAVDSIVTSKPTEPAPQSGDRHLVIGGGETYEGNIIEYVADAWEEQTPLNNWAVKDNDSGVVYIYSSTLEEWIELGAALDYDAGNGIKVDGNTIHVMRSDDVSGIIDPPSSGLKFSEDDGLMVNTGSESVIQINPSGELDLTTHQNCFDKDTSPSPKLVIHENQVKGQEAIAVDYSDYQHTVNLKIHANYGLEQTGDGIKIKLKTATNPLATDSDGLALKYNTSDFTLINDELALNANALIKKVQIIKSSWASGINVISGFGMASDQYNVSSYLKVGNDWEQVYLHITILSSDQISVNVPTGSSLIPSGYIRFIAIG